VKNLPRAGALPAGVLPAVAVIVILGALYGLAGLHRTVSLAAGTPPQQLRVAPVTSVTRACPDPGSAASPGSGIAVMSAPAGARADSASLRAGLLVTRLAGPGSATPGPQLPVAGRPGSPVFALVGTGRAGGTKPAGISAPPGTGGSKGQGTRGTGAGQPQKTAAGTVPTGPAQGGVVVQASGALAQGLEVEQTAGGLPTAACGSPGTDFWFTGPGQRTAGRIQLYLINPTGQAADADADVFTDAGPLQETTDTGITVPPHGMVVQTLAGTLRNSRAITLHVRTSVGQVVAAVQESTGTGQGGWLPPAQPPATRLVIPGLPAIAGTRQLYVAVPGLKDASVQVTAVTSRGSYQPTGATGIDLPAGSAAEISLPSLAGIPAALRLTSNTPITASMLIPGGSGGSPGPITAAVPAILEQGVVADSMVGPARASSLVLSAPARAAQVTVTQVAAGAPARRQAQTVQIGAGKSVVVQLRAIPGAPRGTPFALVLTPSAGSGPVYAGRAVTGTGAGGALQALQPVVSALSTVPLPAVRNASITTTP
jgi:hypothetical protein